MASTSRNGNGKKTPLSTHLVAGGAAGFAEACACHPLDTIKVRMQLRQQRAHISAAAAAAGSPMSRASQLPNQHLRQGRPTTVAGGRTTMPGNNFFATGVRIVQREGVPALYKGLGAVVSGIVPKMAIRFWSFELYKSFLADADGKVPTMGVFTAGLGAGVTEAVMVVNPMELIKIRLQAQRHSLSDPQEIPKYRNAGHAMYTIVREEGIRVLYRGVTLTAARQATNQAVNFTVYQEFKKRALEVQNLQELPAYQHLLLGGISGAMGPLTNAPLDTIKTRLQRMAFTDPSLTPAQRIRQAAGAIMADGGVGAFYRGLSPRILRVAPGQAVVFMVYERVKREIERFKVGAIPVVVESE